MYEKANKYENNLQLLTANNIQKHTQQINNVKNATRFGIETAKADKLDDAEKEKIIRLVNMGFLADEAITELRIADEATTEPDIVYDSVKVAAEKLKENCAYFNENKKTQCEAK
jgi:hypothetical protein